MVHHPATIKGLHEGLHRHQVESLEQQEADSNPAFDGKKKNIKTEQAEATAESKVTDRMMVWFECAHLPPDLQEVSRQFHALAKDICVFIQPGPERSVSLRKLLEAKDAAVRATVKPWH